ncbi:MAG: universal stress protein [Methanomicrobiales archaeon]|jgi:nucleotide-binding universal stress UspA family protein|nr:universal stress protein [Methanomicrobiales archaeon]
MFKNILVAIDGSKVSERALQAAIEEARIRHAHLHVIYIIETGLFSSLPMDNTWEVMCSLLEKEGKMALSKANSAAVEAGVKLETAIRQGHAGSEIVRYASEANADLVVVGSHGRSDVDRLLLGSVSSFVVGNCKAAVLVVRP